MKEKKRNDETSRKENEKTAQNAGSQLCGPGDGSVEMLGVGCIEAACRFQDAHCVSPCSADWHTLIARGEHNTLLFIQILMAIETPAQDSNREARHTLMDYDGGKSALHHPTPCDERDRAIIQEAPMVAHGREAHTH